MATSSQKIRYDIEAAVFGEGDVAALARQLESLADTLEGDLKTQAQASALALRELGAKQGAIDNFVQLKKEAGDAAAKLGEAQSAAQKLGQSMAASGAPTRAQTGQLEKLRDAVRSTKTEVQEKTRALDNSRAGLAAYGIASNNVATAERNVRTALAAARAEVQSLAPAYTAAGSAAAASGAKQTASATAVKSSLSDVGSQLRNIQNIAATAIGGTFITSLARDIADVADEYNNLAARIKLVTGEGAAFDAAFQGVQQIALATNSELEATGTLFARISQAGKELGLSQEAALSLTQTINQAIQLSGGSAESAKASIIQLVQGLQSGVLRGEEFNSVMEQSPRLAQALAAGLGKTTGELRAMAKEGQLTTEVVLNALRSQSKAVAEEFASLPPTVGRAIQNLSTSWTLYIGQADKATGATAAAAGAINLVAKNLETLIDVATRAGAVLVAAMGVQAVGALRAYIAQATAAGAATNLLSLQLSKVPTSLKITVALVGFEAAYQFGDMLRENSQTAREFGIQFVDFIQKQVNSLQFLKEAGAAVFTSDTISAALDRYNERAAQQREIIAGMMADAAKAPVEIEAGAKKAAEAVVSIGDAAQDNADLFKKQAEEYKASAAKQVEATEAISIARRGDAEIALSGLNVQRELARQSLDMAELLGDESAVRKAKIQQLEIEIRITKAKVGVARAEAEGSIAVAQAKLAELQANGQLTAVKEAEIQLSIKLAQAKLAEAEAVGKSSSLLEKQLEMLQKTSVATNGAAGSMRDLATAADGAGNAIERNMADGKQAVDGFAKGVADAAAQLQRLKDLQGFAGAGGDLSEVSTEDLKKAQADLLKEGGALSSKEYIKLRNELMGRGDPKTDANGFTLDKTGNTLAMGGELTTLTGIANFAQAAGLQLEAARKLALEFSDGKGNIPYFSNPGQMKYNGETLSAAVLKAVERVTFGTGQGGAAGVGRTVNVNLITNGRTRTVPTTENGAKDLIETLQAASLAAGR